MNNNMHPDPEEQMNGDEHPPAEMDDLEDIEDFGQEYQLLDSTMDQLNAKLDAMEQQNDDLFAKFKDLLESSRQARKEMEEERRAGNNSQESAAGCSSVNDKPSEESKLMTDASTNVQKDFGDKS